MGVNVENNEGVNRNRQLTDTEWPKNRYIIRLTCREAKQSTINQNGETASKMNGCRVVIISVRDNEGPCGIDVALSAGYQFQMKVDVCEILCCCIFLNTVFA